MKPHWSPAYVCCRLLDRLYRLVHPGAPWLTPRAIRILDAWLQPSHTVLEWGAGRSTLWFAERVKHVTSIEDSAYWFTHIWNRCSEWGYFRRQKVTLLLRQSRDSYLWIPSCIFNRKVDLVLVDGRARSACLELAIDLVKPGGKIVLDDGHRYFALGLGRSYARQPDDGPHPQFRKFLQLLRGWRFTRTTNGIKDTLIWTKPTDIAKAPDR